MGTGVVLFNICGALISSWIINYTLGEIHFVTKGSKSADFSVSAYRFFAGLLVVVVAGMYLYLTSSTLYTHVGFSLILSMVVGTLLAVICALPSFIPANKERLEKLLKK